ncbi:Der GTPase-activating protein YihI [Thalassotalea profundi]|uniref:Der GTPase-activating protein YihI n=1 Tax=Thalassotalea profundi TaxID=2036687 RepID=A0ABQ3IN10_9GAMM|nr:Der GTPase-activating protein YihI [Thalassotalea profundi]GHE88393.1 Der GTPase-activating protein YihI [Thalassotalea profundi]
MSRIKKSRKPSFVPTIASKEDKKREIVASDRKPKKKNGKQSGNRQKEAIQVKQTSQVNNQAKDPRIGSKKPIDLGKPVAAVTEKPQAKSSKKMSVAPIREVQSEAVSMDIEALKQELYAIEDDSYLQTILAKQEDNIALTENEVDFFNEKMARHEVLREILGWDNEDDENTATKHSDAIDEEALWDKLDKPNLSDFE